MCFRFGPLPLERLNHLESEVEIIKQILEEIEEPLLPTGRPEVFRSFPQRGT